MKAIMFFFFVTGMILFIHGIYQQKFDALKDNVRVEYRFIPRTYYEEQLANASVASNFKNMFNKSSPWFERTVSGGDDKKREWWGTFLMYFFHIQNRTLLAFEFAHIKELFFGFFFIMCGVLVVHEPELSRSKREVFVFLRLVPEHLIL